MSVPTNNNISVKKHYKISKYNDQQIEIDPMKDCKKPKEKPKIE